MRLSFLQHIGPAPDHHVGQSAPVVAVVIYHHSDVGVLCYITQALELKRTDPLGFGVYHYVKVSTIVGIADGNDMGSSLGVSGRQMGYSMTF
jgi:hypothetical protein